MERHRIAHIVKATPNAYAALAGAVIAVALHDAQRGDRDAVAWLATTGREWLDLLAPAHVDGDALLDRLAA